MSASARWRRRRRNSDCRPGQCADARGGASTRWRQLAGRADSSRRSGAAAGTPLCRTQLSEPKTPEPEGYVPSSLTRPLSQPAPMTSSSLGAARSQRVSEANPRTQALDLSAKTTVKQKPTMHPSGHLGPERHKWCSVVADGLLLRSWSVLTGSRVDPSGLREPSWSSCFLYFRQIQRA